MSFDPIRALVFMLPLLAGCWEEKIADAPAPAPLTRDAIGSYCNMTVADHAGPKSQIHLTGNAAPIWFSSVRDAVAFTMLPGESKNVSAIYVHDVDKMKDWTHPDDNAWIDAQSAHYVIGSRMKGGMGLPETAPFSTIEGANAFAAKHGGKVVNWRGIPRDYVIIDEGSSGTDKTNHSPTDDQHDGGGHGHKGS